MIINNSKYNQDWQTKSLNELGTFRRGKSKHRPRNDKALFENGKFPLIQTGEIKEANLFITSHINTYNDFGLKQSKLWPKNTLCITIAANIAETAILDYPMCFPDSVVGFNAFENESSELFMHYVFTYIKRAIQNAASGSIQDNINIDFLTNLNFKIPKKESQDKIAKVLSDLDAKIELNNRINAEMEAMAKTLYDYWFVQFDFPDASGKPYKTSGGKMVYSTELKRQIPEGWVKCNLVDVLTSTGTGLNPRDNFSLGEGENYYVTIKNIQQGKVVLDNRCDKINDDALEIINKRSNLMVGDILFTSIEPVGITYLILEKPKNWNINESVFTIRPNYEKVTSEFLYMFLSGDYIKAYTKNVSAGSIHKGVRHSTLKECKFILPENKIIKDFSVLISPILKKMDLIQKQNQELASLRDWLLPMLMNGQVSVGDVAEELGMVAESNVEYEENKNI
ncbi:restriction endonuclease subunit S [Flavobacterium yafengii]|uniref:restriction endonuclease subunit S n=1 Tax=Flavobacterium yafengii TaxID=3041253 RepID=UPI0024A8965E|nr:restriction endonuclease subunit S [Flavobacterium yafengii]MDI6047411.1 restriction endonuclease subunit S [Flavobacterium yafengii]